MVVYHTEQEQIRGMTLILGENQPLFEWMTPVTVLLTATPSLRCTYQGFWSGSGKPIWHHSPPFFYYLTLCDLSGSPDSEMSPPKGWQRHLCWLKQNNPSAVPWLLNRPPGNPLATLCYSPANVGSVIRLRRAVDSRLYRSLLRHTMRGIFSSVFSISPLGVFISGYTPLSTALLQRIEGWGVSDGEKRWRMKRGQGGKRRLSGRLWYVLKNIHGYSTG